MVNIYPHSISKIANELITICKHRGFKIATAESCTGGLIAGSLTAVSGSSAVFERGFNTYSNESKCELLNVPLGDIETFGAVSEKIAEKMAVGALKNAPVNLTVAVTGIAGPEGGTPNKPVGTVHIASACSGGVTLKKMFLFEGDRETIRLDTVKEALKIMLLQVVD